MKYRMFPVTCNSCKCIELRKYTNHPRKCTGYLDLFILCRKKRD